MIYAPSLRDHVQLGACTVQITQCPLIAGIWNVTGLETADTREITNAGLWCTISEAAAARLYDVCTLTTAHKY